MRVEIDSALQQDIGCLDAGARLPPLELGRAQHVQPVLLTLLAMSEEIGPLFEPRIYGFPVERLDGFQQRGFRDHSAAPFTRMTWGCAFLRQVDNRLAA